MLSALRSPRSSAVPLSVRPTAAAMRDCTVPATVAITPRRGPRSQRPSLDLPQRRRRRPTREPGDVVLVTGRRGASARAGALQRAHRRSRCACSTRDAAPPDGAELARPDRRGGRLSRARSASTRRPAAWSTARPIGCPASSSIATATSRACRRCRRARIDGSAELVGAARRALARRAASSRATIRASAGSRGSSSTCEVLYGDVPDVDRGARRARPLRGRSVHGQKTGLFLDQRENRQAAAGYARGRALDAFSYHGGFALALAPALRRRCSRSTSRRTPSPRIARQRRPQRPRERRGARSERVRRAARARAARRAVRHHRARPAGVRQEQGRRSREGAAGYKEINLRALKLLEPAAILVTCSCSYNVGEAMFAGRRCGRRRSTRARRSTRRREAHAGARPPGPADGAGDATT